MTASDPHARARCESCDHLYRVPDPTHTYRCKACGGTVRAIHEEEAHLAPAELDAATRLEANEALKHGYGWMSAVTWLFRLGALAYGFVTVLAVLSLADSAVPVGAGVLVVALSTVLTALMLIGALQIDFKPFVWTATVAGLATVVSLAHLVGPDPMGLAFYWSAAWAVLFWLALVPTWRSRQLIAAHTDLYILHHASRRTRHAIEAHPVEEHHERLLRAMRSAVRHAWKLSAIAAGAIFLVSLLGSYTVYANLRPQQLSIATASFEKAGAQADLDAIGQLFSRQVHATQSVRLSGLIEGHGWGKAWPRLADGSPREEEGLTWVDYATGELTVETSWAVEGRTWSLVSVELPVPPLEPVIERFQQAWRRSDAQALSGFFSGQYQQRMLESIENSVRRRRWSPFPDILASSTRAGEDGVTILTLSVPSGDVTAKWIFRADGRWGLKGLQFPKP